MSLNKNSLALVPSEIVSEILQFVNPITFYSSMNVCKLWKKLINSLEECWKRHCKNLAPAAEVLHEYYSRGFIHVNPYHLKDDNIETMKEELAKDNPDGALTYKRLWECLYLNCGAQDWPVSDSLSQYYPPQLRVHQLQVMQTLCQAELTVKLFKGSFVLLPFDPRRRFVELAIYPRENLLPGQGPVMILWDYAKRRGLQDNKLTAFIQACHADAADPWIAQSCEHISSCSTDAASIRKLDDNTAEGYQCAECGMKRNLWMCLTCGHIGCGREGELPFEAEDDKQAISLLRVIHYANGHAMEHAETSGHPCTVKASVDTAGEFHCYECDCDVRERASLQKRQAEMQYKPPVQNLLGFQPRSVEEAIMQAIVAVGNCNPSLSSAFAPDDWLLRARAMPQGAIKLVPHDAGQHPAGFVVFESHMAYGVVFISCADQPEEGAKAWE